MYNCKRSVCTYNRGISFLLGDFPVRRLFQLCANTDNRECFSPDGGVTLEFRVRLMFVGFLYTVCSLCTRIIPNWLSLHVEVDVVMYGMLVRVAILFFCSMRRNYRQRNKTSRQVYRLSAERHFLIILRKEDENSPWQPHSFVRRTDR